jgi:hypothetical protein
VSRGEAGAPAAGVVSARAESVTKAMRPTLMR